MQAPTSKDLKRTVSSSQCRQKRRELSVSLRKNKRMESLAKRRALQPSGSSSNGGTTAQENVAVGSIAAKVSSLPQMKAALYGQDTRLKFDAAQAVRKLLSKDHKPPVMEVLEAGLMDGLMACLDAQDTNLVFEALWALTNIGSTEHTGKLVEAGILPKIVPLLRSPSADVRDQAVWCIGNIAGDCTQFRDLVLTAPGLVESIILNLKQPEKIALLRNFTWVASNCLRGKPRPSYESIEALALALCELATKTDDEDTLRDLFWALSYVTDGENNRLELVLRSGIVGLLVQKMKQWLTDKKKEDLVSPLLRTLGNIVTGNDHHTQAVIDAGLLECLAPLTSFPKSGVKKEACWTASNITAGTVTQIQQFLDTPGLPEAILYCLSNSEYQTRKEAAWTFCNIATTGNPRQVKKVVDEYKIIDQLVDILKSEASAMILPVLQAIESILRVSPEEYTLLLNEAGGLDIIEDLQENEDDKVYELCQKLIQEFFGEDSENEQNLAPNLSAAGNAFAFSTKTFGENAAYDFSSLQNLN